MAKTTVGPLLVAAVAALVACAPTPAAPAGPPTYDRPPEAVRTDETPLHLPAVTQGETRFELLGLTAGMPTVIGSHADWPAKGQFVRIRLAATNTGRTTVLFDTRHQQLRASDGSTRHPDDQAMLIKRQPAALDLGSGVRLEFDLWFDIPTAAHPAAVRLFGGGTLTDLTDGTGVEVALPASS